MIAAETSARIEALDALAALLAYPDERLPEAVRSAGERVAVAFPEASRALEPFLRAAASTAPVALEELFARTFDWSTTVGLEVGWHLYGEQYDRGAFLVRMRERLRAAGIEEGCDLPDHLGSCLRLLGRIPAEEAAELARTSILPATAKILVGFGEDPNPYASVIRAVQAVLAEVAGPAGAGGGR